MKNFTDMKEENRLLVRLMVDRAGGKIACYCENGGISIELPEGIKKWNLIESLARSFGLEMVKMYELTDTGKIGGHFQITHPEIAVDADLSA